MKEMIPQRLLRAQFRAHLGACVLLAAATIWPGTLAMPAAIALGLSALLLEASLLSALRRFLRHGGRLK